MLARLAAACLLVAAATPALADDPTHGHTAPTSTAGKAPVFNLGPWHRAITTSSPEAQRYFDQGLALAYGFNHAQAAKAFAEVARIDSTCAMAWWGAALVLGPNINMPMDAAAEQPAWDAVRKAVALAPKASDVERALIEALAKRYADPADGKRPPRAALDSAYANAMRQVANRFPDDGDVGTLFAEALMDLNPWKFWSSDGKAAPGTDEIVATLEGVLKKFPNQPGANHYYIHAVEASAHPERALPAADRMGPMVPEAGHLVHMPSHIWARVGRYNDAVSVNVDAARVDSLYLAAQQPGGMYPLMYYTHNVHFVWSMACFAGRSADAAAAARYLVSIVPPETYAQMPGIEFFTASPVLGMVRFGRWAEILAEPRPTPHTNYTTGMWHFARGYALSATGKVAEAKRERDSLVAIAAATPPEAMASLNSQVVVLRLAGHMLSADIEARQGRVKAALAHYQSATREEDALNYDEPPAWSLPVRQARGAMLLAAGRVKEAEADYREDLRRFPENGWSLFGLAKCLRALKADAAAAQVEQRFAKAWGKADVTITASQF